MASGTRKLNSLAGAISSETDPRSASACAAFLLAVKWLPSGGSFFIAFLRAGRLSLGNAAAPERPPFRCTLHGL